MGVCDSVSFFHGPPYEFVDETHDLVFLAFLHQIEYRRYLAWDVPYEYLSTSLSRAGRSVSAARTRSYRAD